MTPRAASHGRHAVYFLVVRNILRCNRALDLTPQEGKVHVVHRHKEKYIPRKKNTNERREFGKPIVGECLALEAYRVIRLGAGFG